MVARVGFEPTASGLWARRATRLLYLAIIIIIIIIINGGERGIRTLAGYSPLSVFKTDPFNRLGISPSIYILVDSTGLEPVTDRLWADCSDHCAKSPNLVATGGLEPSTYRVWADRSSQLSYVAKWWTLGESNS